MTGKKGIKTLGKKISNGFHEFCVPVKIKQIKIPHTKVESCPPYVSIQINCDNFDL